MDSVIFYEASKLAALDENPEIRLWKHGEKTVYIAFSAAGRQAVFSTDKTAVKGVITMASLPMRAPG